MSCTAPIPVRIEREGGAHVARGAAPRLVQNLEPIGDADGRRASAQWAATNDAANRPRAFFGFGDDELVGQIVDVEVERQVFRNIPVAEQVDQCVRLLFEAVIVLKEDPTQNSRS